MLCSTPVFATKSSRFARFAATLCLAFVSLLSVAQSAPLKAKKTVCTVTINSSEEARAFREHLSPDQWNFVELANPEDTSKSGWFRNACEKKISCDILILSGHFGGTFFGSETELRLSMEELESASCQAKCKGIIDQPKEVFLFGCNTLASKEKDTRTPEEYQRVLVADGFSVSQASQIAAFRYSAFGDSFKGRMAQVFANTPRIYGFSALAPSGTTVEPLLKRYLGRSSEFYSNFDESNKVLKSGTNSALKQAFNYTTLVQVPGLTVAIEALNKKPSPRAATPYCFLADDGESRLSKLSYIKTSLQEGRAFTFISHIDKFVNDAAFMTSPPNAAEQQTIQEMATDPKIKKDFEQYLRLPGDVYLPVRVNVLNLMRGLGVLSVEEHAKLIQKHLDLDFSRPLTRAKVDSVCSYDVQAEVEASDIPDARWTEYETFSLLRCLRPRNSGIHQRLADILTKSQEKALSFNASWALGELNVTDKTIHRQLADAMLKHKSNDVRQYAIDALGAVKTLDMRIVRDIMNVLQKDPDWSIRQNAAYAFRTIHTTDIIVLKALVDVMLHDEVWGIRSAASEALRINDPQDPSIRSFKALWDGQTK